MTFGHSSTCKLASHVLGTDVDSKNLYLSPLTQSHHHKLNVVGLNESTGCLRKVTYCCLDVQRWLTSIVPTPKSSFSRCLTQQPFCQQVFPVKYICWKLSYCWLKWFVSLVTSDIQHSSVWLNGISLPTSKCHCLPRPSPHVNMPWLFWLPQPVTAAHRHTPHHVDCE